MRTDDLRQRYLDFFKSKHHRIFGSDSLVPSGDPSVLFTSAGMNQFKPYFLGLKKDVTRATSCQKCLRTADLDRVGKTATHHSFFEMLGNFSFGDYFKEEAIGWGWEFVTRELGLAKDKLWVSVYEEDDEAFEIWKKKIGVPEARIVRMGAKDNFWPSNAKLEGPNGPCGPCSEIYVGREPGKGVEIWNLVFTQFDRQSDGTLKDLPQRNIDTGMGLERTAAVLQGVENNFDIDIFQGIRKELRRLLVKKDRFEIAHENAVMDHMRAVSFAIADGALPSNDGRGYVIRKLIRLASDHLEKAGVSRPGSLCRLVSVGLEAMKAAYPELEHSRKNIETLVEKEENSYLEMLRLQAPRLKHDLQAATEAGRSSPRTAEIAFKYYDTFGLPYETIETISAELGIAMDRTGFEKLLDQQKQRSREKSKIAGEIFSKEHAAVYVEGLPGSRFLGYETTEGEGRLLRIFKGKERVERLRAGEEGALIFDATPFYAEAGGQVGDTGTVSAGDFKATVTDTQWMEKCIAHYLKVEAGEIRTGQTASLAVDLERRSLIMKNHTATHLLHSALRQILGEHVKQSGSLVAPDRLRFDFTHFKALDTETLGRVEARVNQEIQKNTRLEKKVMPKEEALKKGAIAFFGEKYGEAVRVVTVGDFSKEFCGGTHLDSTGEIRLFKIVSEGSIQAGVRRIEAVTGPTALAVAEAGEKEMKAIARAFHVREEALAEALGGLEEKVSELRNRIFGLLNQKVGQRMERSLKASTDLNGVKVVVEKIDRADVELLKGAADHLRSTENSFVALLASEFDEKISFVVAASSNLVQKGFHAGKIVKDIAAVVEGNGGGRPDFAVGGGKGVAKKKEALALGEKTIRENLARVWKAEDNR
ncbi:MAG: alanine--tRNA ligase [Candidatus Omnitrophica bacterium]|nr:alanine--tRNA ligase [Candidatus Omnitrophota bacterium]